MSVKLIFRVILDIICLVIGKVPNFLVLIFYNNLTKSVSRSNNCTRTSKLTVLFRSLIVHSYNKALDNYSFIEFYSHYDSWGGGIICYYF